MSTVVDEVKKMLESAFESQAWGNKLLTAQGVDSRQLSDVAPMDDEVPPEGPQNVMATPFLGAVSIQWDTPRRYDYVTAAIIEYIPQAGENANEVYTTEVRNGTNGSVIYDLDYVDHKFRVKFLDRWDRESPWSNQITSRPNETADYKIDLAKAALLGNVTSMMSLINSSLIAGENFAAGTVRQIALAQPEHPNQLPMIEVDFDQWDVGQTWPPPDNPAPINEIEQPPYISAILPQGITAKVAEFSGRKWLEVTRATATTPDPRFWPFATWKRRETMPDNYYIASVYVQGEAGTQVRFAAEASTNNLGTNVIDLAQTNAVTLDGSPEGTRIFFKFFMGNTHPFIRFRLDTITDNRVSRWTRFQLEQADVSKTEPGPWTPGVLSVGIVNSRMLTAIDANIANALFKNAAIESAAIKSLSADKIDAGLLNAGVINVASRLEMHQGITDASGTQMLPPGVIRAGNTWMSSSGLSLLAQDSYYTPASMRTDPTLRSSAIFGRNADGSAMDSAIAFVDDTRTGFRYRGIVARADGTDTDDGLIALHATNDGSLSSQTTAKVEVRAGKRGSNGVVSINRNLQVADLVLANDFKISGGNADGKTLSGHSHKYSEINDKPDLSKFLQSGDNFGAVKASSFTLDGRSIHIESGSGRQYLFAA